MNKIPRDIILQNCNNNHDHMLYCSSDMTCDTSKFLFFILGYFFHFYPPHSPKNENFKKMKKTPRAIII